MNTEELIRSYIPKVNIMQLATVAGDQPWVCAVHFCSDDDLNLYWFSTEERRHSQELVANPVAAAYVLVHENTPDEKYVIGISIQGTVECLGAEIQEDVGQSYIKKLGRDPSFIDDIRSGKNIHKLFKLKPSKIVLFDSKNFHGDPRQEWVLCKR